jgi:ParB family chromosome partitioning protein
MSDPVKRSIASMLAEKVAKAAAAPTEEQAELDLAEERGSEEVAASMLPGQQLLNIPVDLISPAAGGQARQAFDEERLKALADSLKRSGVREPIIVTPHGAEAGRFEIVAGERRWRAAQLAGLTEIPCIVDAKLVERKDKLLAQAEENLHRENLNPVEEAAVLAQLMESRGIDVREAGELIGRGYRQARRLLQLHTAAAPIKKALARGQIDARAATELVRIFTNYARGDESPGNAKALRRIDTLIERIVSQQWSLRTVEQFAARVAGGAEAQGADEGETGAGPPLAPSPSPAATSGEPVFARRGSRILIDVSRLEHGEIRPEERATLIALLEDLLTKTRHAKLGV